MSSPYSDSCHHLDTRTWRCEARPLDVRFGSFADITARSRHVRYPLKADGSEPRGLPGGTIRTVEFQQRESGRPLDDVIVQATNADGSAAVLEIQAKRTLTFTASDKEFTDVVARMWEAAQKPEFETSRYELAVAMARTTTRVEHACQEVLHWARQLPDGATFAANINRKKFASNGMRDFVDVFRANLTAADAPTDDETVWRLLRRFQILVFDFKSQGSDYEHRARSGRAWRSLPIRPTARPIYGRFSLTALARVRELLGLSPVLR